MLPLPEGNLIACRGEGKPKALIPTKWLDFG